MINQGVLIYCNPSRSSLNLKLVLSPSFFCPQCRRAAVVRRVSLRVQRQPVIAPLLHPAPVQSAPRSAHALLLPPAVQRQLQDDGAQRVDPRHGPGTWGGGAQAARIHSAEEGPGGLGLWTDENGQSHALPGQRWWRSEAAVTEERGERRKEAEGEGKEEGAEGQELGERFPRFFLFMTLGHSDFSPSQTVVFNLSLQL